jgi:VWFA-related protein
MFVFLPVEAAQDPAPPAAPPSTEKGAPQSAEKSDTVIRAETKLVLVDAVVTDKRGGYVRDLTAKDFKVWEDKKEQKITSFSFEADPNFKDNRTRYMVLLFDDANLPDVITQSQARKAAVQFVEHNANPQSLIAVADFNGVFKMTQNFTASTDKLIKACRDLKLSVMGAGDPGTFNIAFQEFSVRSSLQAIYGLAKGLSGVPGRKSVVWLTGGFRVPSEMMSEVTATIDACNRANVAVYPIDIRGLITGVTADHALLRMPGQTDLQGDGPLLKDILWNGTGGIFRTAFYQAHTGGGGTSPGGGGGGAKGGGTPGGSTGGGKTGGTGATGGGKSGGTAGSAGGRSGGGSIPSQPYMNNPYNQSRQSIIPPLNLVSSNQDIMYLMAGGTGGFVIVNNNDFLAGMEKIAKEQTEHYLLGYSPEDSEEGSCHSLKVKVEHGYSVRSRTGYCNAKPTDYLAGTTQGKSLESRVSAAGDGDIPTSFQAPFVYSSADTARVNLAMEIPTDKLSFQKSRGRMTSDVNVLGVAYRPDGKVAARFSDTMKLEAADKKELAELKERPAHYERQFEIAPGQYTLKVAFTSDDKHYGKSESPLVIDRHPLQDFGMSALVLSKEFHRVAELDSGLDALLVQDQVPLIVDGYQIVPTGSNRYANSQRMFLFAEIYEPLLANLDADAKPAAVAFQFMVTNKKTGEKVASSDLKRLATKAQSPVVPFVTEIPISKLAAGSYQVEVKTLDSAGRSFVRNAEFEMVSQ